MEVVETELEIFRISKPVSLPFEGLDLVLLTFEARIPAAALRAPNPLIVNLGAADDPVGHKMSRFVVNTFQPQSHGKVSMWT